MGLILSILMLGLAARLSPATILVFILVLGTTRARVNAGAFLIGWAVSLTVVFTVSYLFGTSRSTQQGGGRTGLLILEVLLGCALVVLGVRSWRRRGEVSDEERGIGSTLLTRRLTDLSPPGAALIGVLKQPWAITTAAAVVIVHHHAPPGLTVLAFACFMIASTASVGLMYAFYSRRPGQATAYLEQLRTRAIAVGPTLFAVAALFVGIFLIFDGLDALLS
jgi:hypothetical protein